MTRYHKKIPLHILIGNENTCNFLNVQIANKYGCKIQELEPIKVVVGEGFKLDIYSIVKNLSWTIQKTTFTLYMLISLGCYDMVLEIK